MSRERSNGLRDLIDHQMDWGVSVAEPKVRPSAAKKALKLAAYAGFILSSFVAIPVLIAFVVFPGVEGLTEDALMVVGLAAIAAIFQAQSRRGPKNALQIDYAAAEVRLGTELPDGTFVRHRVCGFRHIQKVSVDSSEKARPAINLHLKGETVTLRFHGANPRSLDLVAAKISAARESAQKAPLRSRVQSMFMGIDATYREVGQRVKSRVVSRAV